MSFRASKLLASPPVTLLEAVPALDATPPTAASLLMVDPAGDISNGWVACVGWPKPGADMELPGPGIRVISMSLERF